MFLAQLAVSMVVWAATVVALVRNRERSFAYARRLSRGRRLGVAGAALLLSIALLALGMAALATGGLTSSGLTWWGWPLITLVGVAFVVLQTGGLVPLVLNAVTRGAPHSSDRVDPDRP